MTALARTGRPALWLAVAAGTVWPFTPTAVAAALVALAGAICAVVAVRDPRIPSATGEGERWRTFMLSLCTLLGMVATVLEPRGAGYVCALVAGALIGRIVLDARIIWGFSVLAGLGIGLTLANATGLSWLLLVALSVPALASRSLDRARLHREHTRVLALLTERDALREVELAAAAGEERARIARDLHDVLAHTLSGLSLHLQGIRAVATKRLGTDDPVITSVDRAADLARAGLAEAKQAVAALRDDAADAAPRVADLTALAEEHDAELAVSGDVDALPARLRETVFATVREALTNVGRHAPGAAVTVSVVAAADALEVRVSDDGVSDGGVSDGGPAPGSTTGPVAAGARGDVGGGQGLVGLRERAELVGGTLDSGPDRNPAEHAARGWRVTLHVPLPVTTGRVRQAGAVTPPPGPGPLRVVLADDQAVVRDGLAMLLSAADDLDLVATAADGTQAVEVVLAQRPDVALVDLRMPGLDGAQVTETVRRDAPEVRVLILTTYADDDAVLPALRAGAAGYLTKDTTGEALLAAIRTVAAGGSVLDAAVQRRLVNLAGAPAAPKPSPPDLPEGLTAREVDVLRLVAQGLSNHQTASRLVVSEATVKTHVNHLISKLAVDGRPALVAWAWRNGVAEAG